MKHSIPIPALLLCILLWLPICQGRSFGQSPTILYKLAMPKPSTHLFDVEIRFELLPAEESLDVILPVWRPGRYAILDFASGIQNFSAVDGHGRPLAWRKNDKSTWEIQCQGTSTVDVTYKVYADEFTMRTRGLNSEHGFVDETSVFMYVEKYRNLPVTLEVEPFHGWHVTTGLEGTHNKFTAPSYDYFIDCPLEIGTQKDFSFTVDDVPHILSIEGEGNWNADTLVRDIGKIVAFVKNFWGEFPYKRYVFLVECMSNPTGATEHLNSTIVQTGSFIFRNPESYHSFLRNVTHEYFHTWNVKQLRPHAIDPYDFTKENYSKEYWIAEGTTSYYDGLLMERLGFIKPDEFLSALADVIRDDRQRPGNRVQSVSEASFDVWVKDSRGTEQRLNAESNFYAKGATVSMALDFQLRKLTLNKYSLDDLMRTMLKRYPLSRGGYTLGDVQQVAEELSGTKFGTFFDDYIYGTRPLPWEEMLSWAGLELSSKDSTKKPWVGMGLSGMGERTMIWNVVAGSPAESAGVEVGDELLALNHYRVRSSDFMSRLSEMKAGDVFTITVFRDDKLRDINITAGVTPVPVYTVGKAKSATPEQRAIYESWLGTKW